jgi:hypothetical protein
LQAITKIPNDLLVSLQRVCKYNDEWGGEPQYAHNPDRPGLKLLKGLALQWRYKNLDGVECEAGINEESEIITFCRPCHSHLRHGNVEKPSKLSLANGFSFGEQPKSCET